MEIAWKTGGWNSHHPRHRGAGIAVTVLLHIVAVAALLQHEPLRSALSEAAPIMVNLIKPQPVVEKPQVPPKALPVKPRVQQPTPPEPGQLVTAVADAPAPVLAPTPPPAAPIQAAPPPATAVVVPVVPPNFNADYLDNPPPAYPPLSRRLGEQGKVMLHVLVNPRGTADKVELKSSSGSSRLDDAAIESVKHWRFVPARQGDQAVAAWVLIPITFSLKG
jgi:protein TonB